MPFSQCYRSINPLILLLTLLSMLLGRPVIRGSILLMYMYDHLKVRMWELHTMSWRACKVKMKGNTQEGKISHQYVLLWWHHLRIHPLVEYNPVLYTWHLHRRNKRICRIAYCIMQVSTKELKCIGSSVHVDTVCDQIKKCLFLWTILTSVFKSGKTCRFRDDPSRIIGSVRL